MHGVGSKKNGHSGTSTQMGRGGWETKDRDARELDRTTTSQAWLRE